MSDYELAMPFIDGSKSFTNGYECGVVSEQMRQGKPFSNYLVHTANREQIKMLAKRSHYEVRFDDVDETWSIMSGERTNAN